MFASKSPAATEKSTQPSPRDGKARQGAAPDRGGPAGGKAGERLGMSVDWDFRRVAIFPPDRDEPDRDDKETSFSREAAVPAFDAPISVGARDDPAEIDADRQAERVMLPTGRGEIGGSARPGRGEGASDSGREAPAIVYRALQSPGRPLDGASRAFFEPRFGFDFSRVRIHDGPLAARSARAVEARAFAVGDHIVFAEAPRDDRALMAHELAHVTQNAAQGGGGVLRRAPPGSPPAAAISSNFSPIHQTLLQQARDEFQKLGQLQPGDDHIVGVLVTEDGRKFNLISGGGQGFSTHIEGKATAKMNELGVKKAILVCELEPCQICDRSTYDFHHGPEKPMTSSLTGKEMSRQTSKINTALPRDSELIVVGPKSTSKYSGVAPIPKAAPAAPAAAAAAVESEPPPSSARAGAGAVQATEAAEAAEEGRPRPRVPSGAAEAPGPGLKTKLGAAALGIGAGIASGLLQDAFREKIAEDLAKLPKPKVDKRGALEFLSDPAQNEGISLLDVVSKDLKPFTAALPRQHQEIMARAQFATLATALLPRKTDADIEDFFKHIDEISEELSAYDQQLATIQSNLDAMIEMEPEAMKTKASADQLRSQLNTIFTAQAVASQVGVAPMPSVEDFAKMDSNLAHVSASISIGFADVHAAKKAVDDAIEEETSLRNQIRKIWMDAFAEQFQRVLKQRQQAEAAKQAKAAAKAAPPPPPPPERTGRIATPLNADQFGVLAGLRTDVSAAMRDMIGAENDLQVCAGDAEMEALRKKRDEAIANYREATKKLEEFKTKYGVTGGD
jgi:regulator of replication initiation timing